MAAKKTSTKNTNKRPDIDFSTLYQLGLTAQGLAVKHQALIGARLPPAFYTTFDGNLAGLLTAIPAVMNSKDGKTQLTAAQTTALNTGYMLVKGVRTTVKGHYPEKDVLLAYGVGARTSKSLVKDVSAAIQQILDRIAAQATEAATFGFVDLDMKALTDALAAIKAADLAQEKGRAAAPLTTQQRNSTANAILAGVKQIAGAGMRTFTDDTTVYASFEGLISKAAG